MAKVKRSRPILDMTPMVDLAFLLVTFFMLTTKFAPEEPVIVDMPSSVSEIKLPDTDILTISISNEGKVFFNMDGKYTREKLIKSMGEKYNLTFSDDEVSAFATTSSIGLPVGNLKEYLNMEPEERKQIQQPGIPCDSAHNELADWIVYSRVSNPKLRIALKGDRNVEYTVFKKVLKTLQDNNINRFNMITNLEQAS